MELEVAGDRQRRHDEHHDANHRALVDRQKVTIIPIRAIRGARIPKTWFAFAAF